MRWRRWVIYSFAVLSLVALTLVLGYRVFHTNERIRQFVLRELRPLVGERFNISHVSLGLGTVHFYDVHIPLGKSGSVLDVQDVRISYNLLKTLFTRFSPLSFSQDILLYKPRFSLFLSDSIRQVGEETSSEEIIMDMSRDKRLASMSFLKRLSILDGEMVLSFPGQSTLPVGKALSGSLARGGNDSLLVRLTGKFFSSKRNNLFIRGAVDLNKSVVQSLQFAFSDYALNTPLPDILPDFITLNDGTMEGNLTLIRNDSAVHNYRMKGGLLIQNGAATLWDDKAKISEFNLALRLENWNALIDSGNFQVNDAKAYFEGSVQNISSPRTDINYHVDNIHVDRIVEPFVASSLNLIAGSGHLRGSVSGPIGNLYSSNDFISPQVIVGGVPLKQVHFRSAYNNRKLTIENLSALVYKNRLKFSGDVGKDGSDIALNGDIHLRGDVASLVQSYFRVTPDSCVTWLDAELSGTLKRPVVYGSFGVDLKFVGGKELSIRNAFSFQNKKLNTLPTSQKSENFAIGSQIDFSSKPWSQQIDLKNINVLLPYLSFIPSSIVPGNLRIDLSSGGTFASMDIVSQLKREQGGMFVDEVARIESHLTRNNKKLLGDGKIFFLSKLADGKTATFRFQKSDKAFELTRFNVPDALDLTFGLYNVDDSTSAVTGLLKTNQFDPIFLFNTADTVIDGKLTSQIKLSGTIEDPLIAGHIQLQDGTLYNNGPYSGVLDFAYDSLGFKLNSWNLKTNESALFYASGQSDRQFSDLNFRLTGAGFDFETLTRSALDNSGLLKGKALIDLRLTGSYQNPVFAGILAVKKGQLYKFPFDELIVRLADSAKTDLPRSFLKPGLRIQELHLSREKQFDISGKGFYPYSADDSLFFSISGEGNFLDILPDLTEYFTYSQSAGSLAIELRGTPSRPEIENASLQFRDGRLSFASVIPEVTEAKMETVFEPENNFLHIRSFSGLVGGEPFEISNELAVADTVNKNLVDFEFGDSDLNLGVFTIESGENAISLNIPGLMEKDDFGRLKFFGKSPGERFYFAGPTERPHLRGRIRLSDTKVMFPFDEGAGKPNGLIETLLNNMEWDIAVTPEQDVRYIRSFPGAIDNVYVNLLIDQQSELDFVGQMNDESLRVIGDVSSTTGLIEYLDMTFRIERAGAEFDNSSLIPVVYGKATTTITDSVGVPTQVYLTPLTVDQAMELKQVEDRVRDEESRGRWDQIRFRLSSDNPNLGNSESQILAALGYAAGSLQGTAFDAIGFGTDNILFRPIFRPVEKTLEQYLGLDYVRFNSRLAKNIIDFNLNNDFELNSRLALLRSTRVVVGKYLANNLFFQYTGQIQAGLDYRYKEKGFGLNHRLGVEYHINPKLLLELEYNYDTLMRYNQEDKRIMLRHWFPF